MNNLAISYHNAITYYEALGCWYMVKVLRKQLECINA